MTLEACITAGPMTSGDNLTINAGAVVTCDRTPSILIGQVTINDGKLLIDGVNIGTGNMINFVGEYLEEINANGRGTFEVKGDWYDIGTTDGTNSQTFNLATYYDSSFCVDVVPMIQVETGRRINYDNSSGTLPVVDDFVRKTSNHSLIGRIVQVESTYLVVKYLTGALVDDDDIEVKKVVDNNGPDYQISWTAKVNHASGDILESGVYQEFGNAVGGGTSRIADFHHGVGGFVFANVFQSTTMTMGSAAGSVGGFVAPSGCNVRVPNVHFSTSDITNYASNNTYYGNSDLENNRYNLVTALGGTIDFSVCNVGSSWFGCEYAFSYSAEYMGATVEAGVRYCSSKVSFVHCVIVQDPMNSAYKYHPFDAIDLPYGIDIIDCMVICQRSRQGICTDMCGETEISGCIVSMPNVSVWATSSVYAFYLYNTVDITFNNNILIYGDEVQSDYGVYMNRCSNIEINNFIYSSSQDETEPTNNNRMIYLSLCSYVTVIGIEFLGNGTPGTNTVYLVDSSHIKVRCVGMIDNKVDMGINGDVFMSMFGVNSNLDIARVWKNNGSVEELININTSTRDVTVTNCSGKYASYFRPRGMGGILFKGLHGGSGSPGGTDGIEDAYPVTYGRQIHDGFRSDTVGYIVCLMITPSTLLDNTTIISGNPKFFKDGDLDMVSGDIIEFEMDYFARGHISFSGTYTSANGGASWNANEWTNVTVDFQYDIGSGWSGTWIDARTASNWTGITITAATGVKLKFRFTATGTQTDMSMFIIDTVTSIAVQKANFHPIDQVECDVVLNGIVVDSRYWIYDSDTSTELAEGTASADPVTETVTVPSGTNLLIRVRKSSASVKYEPFITTAVTNETEINVAIIQQVDEIAT